MNNMKKEMINKIQVPWHLISISKIHMILVLIICTMCVLSGCYVIDYSLSGLENGLGDKYLNQNDLKKCIKHYENGYSFDKKGPFGERAYYKLACVYIRSGEDKRALKIFKNIALSTTNFNYKNASLLQLAQLHFNDDDFLLCEDYLNKIQKNKLPEKFMKKYLDLIKVLKVKFENNIELANLKKLYIEYKNSYTLYRQFILVAPPGIKDFLPTENIMQLQELFQKKKNKYEQLKNNIRREKSLNAAKKAYFKAFYKYRSILPEDPSMFDTALVKNAEKDMLEKFMKWQMIKMGQLIQ